MKQEVAQVVERELGQEPDNVEEVGEGLMHETFSATFGSKEYIVQFSGGGLEDHDALGLCLHCYRLLQEVIPVPEIVTEEPQEINGHEYIIVEKLPGENADSNINPEKTTNAGETLAKIHDFRTFEKPGYPFFENGLEIQDFETGSFKQKIKTDLEEKIEVFRGENMDELAIRLERFSEEHLDKLPEKFEPVLCHQDFSPDNILFENGKVSGVIDFDFAYIGHSQRDLVKSANSFWMHDPGADWDIHETFYNGYRKIRDPGTGFENNEPIYRVDTLTILVGSLIQKGELDEKEKDYYRDRLLEIIEETEERLSG